MLKREPIPLREEMILRIAQKGGSSGIPKGWHLAVGVGPCRRCGHPTSGRHLNHWEHFECCPKVRKRLEAREVARAGKGKRKPR